MMKWLRRILDGRKTSKDENRQKAIHDLLTMSKSDMVDLVRKLNKGVKKNEVFIFIGLLLCIMVAGFPSAGLFIHNPGFSILYLTVMLLIVPFLCYALMLTSSKLAFSNNLVSYLAEFFSITLDTKSHSKSAYMDCLSQSETWKRIISDSELEQPMKTIMD